MINGSWFYAFMILFCYDYMILWFYDVWFMIFDFMIARLHGWRFMNYVFLCVHDLWHSLDWWSMNYYLRFSDCMPYESRVDDFMIFWIYDLWFIILWFMTCDYWFIWLYDLCVHACIIYDLWSVVVWFYDFMVYGLWIMLFYYCMFCYIS